MLHCRVPMAPYTSMASRKSIQKKLPFTLLADVTPFSTLIAHKNWVLLSAVYAGIICFCLFLVCCPWGKKEQLPRCLSRLERQVSLGDFPSAVRVLQSTWGGQNKELHSEKPLENLEKDHTSLHTKGSSNHDKHVSYVDMLCHFRRSALKVPPKPLQQTCFSTYGYPCLEHCFPLVVGQVNCWPVLFFFQWWRWNQRFCNTQSRT